VAANRDEFHARQAAPAGFWQDRPQILAGRDLKAGGTWMGVSRSGRFAAVTNYRGGTEPTAAHSRGELVSGFLSANTSPALFLEQIVKTQSAYSGFNLLAADGEELWWMSNRDGGPRRLEPGVYGLGNLLLDSPQVEKDKARFAKVVEMAPAVESLFGTLAPARILNPTYGTRCSTVLLASHGRWRYAERTFGPEGEAGETRRFEL